MVDGAHTIAGLAAHSLAEVVSVAEQGLAIAHRQLMEEANARQTVQVTLRQKAVTPIHAQVLKILSMSQICIDWIKFKIQII